MRFMIRNRRAGKTHESVRWLREDPGNRVIVTANEVMAVRLRKEYGLTDRQVTSFPGRSLRGRHVDIAVDNADLILGEIFAGNPVRLVTATGEAS